MIDLFRWLLVGFLVLHGIAHLIWFLAAWTSLKTGVGDGSWILPGEVTIRSPIGKILGLLALLVMATLVFSAVLLAFKHPAWWGWAEMGVFLSFITVVPWLRQSPGQSAIMAIIANLVLMFIFALDLSVEVTAA